VGPGLKRSAVDCADPGVRCGVAPFGANGACLRLQSQRDMVEVVVIDSADLPLAD
jgi:hypothetical protein